MNHNLDEMALPQSSRNQELEVISQRIFEPLFDVERFVLDGKIIDNGIDYHCELKYKGNVTGFGFNFQLKSKAIHQLYLIARTYFLPLMNLSYGILDIL